MKVSVIVPDIGGSGGGAGTTLPTIARGLVELGVDTELAIIKPAGDQEARYGGLRIVKLKASRQALSIPALVQYLRQRRPDLVISGPGPMNTFVLAAKELARVDATYIITEHGNLGLDMKKETTGSPKMRLTPYLMKLLYPRAHGIVAPSTAPFDDPMYVEFLENCEVPRAIIPNPLRWGAEREINEPASHPWLEKSTGARIPVAISVGRLAHQKGVDCFLQSLALLNEGGNTVRGLIIGDGPQRSELVNLSAELGLQQRVEFLGHLSNPLPYIRESDVFVLTSRWESYGNVLVEAMACRTPIVATDAPVGPRMLLGDSDAGILVPVDSPRDVAEAVRRILSEDALARRLVVGGDCLARKRTPVNAASAYIDFATSCASGNARLLEGGA